MRRRLVSPWIFRCTLVILGSLFGIAILEIGVRALGLAPEIAPIVLDRPYASFESTTNPLLQYVPKPGSPDISDYGIRDRSYPFAKSEDTFRVVVLGDSIGFGFCNNDESLKVEDTFAKILERKLNTQPLAGYSGAEVINLSVSGYDTIQEVEFFRTKGLAFDPDVVLIGYCLNDSTDSSLELKLMQRTDDWGAFQEFTSHTLRGAFEWSHLARTLWYQWSRQMRKPSSDEAKEPGRRVAGFERLQGLAKDSNFETLVAIFPNLEETSPYPELSEHEAIAQDAHDRQFSVVDLLPTFQEETGGKLLQIRGRCREMHPDEGGHQIAARRIETFIRENYHRSQ